MRRRWTVGSSEAGGSGRRKKQLETDLGFLGLKEVMGVDVGCLRLALGRFKSTNCHGDDWLDWLLKKT